MDFIPVSSILYLVYLLFFALNRNDYMKDCNLVLMVFSYFLSPGSELEGTLGTRLEESHQADSAPGVSS